MDCFMKGLMTVASVTIFSCYSVSQNSFALWIVLFVLHFVLLKVLPWFKGRESLWMFIMVASASVPINAVILKAMNEMGPIFDSWVILGIMRAILYYTVVLSVEEVIMGVLARMIWKRQFRICTEAFAVDNKSRV